MVGLLDGWIIRIGIIRWLDYWMVGKGNGENLVDERKSLY